MEIGKLRKRITIQKMVSVRNSFGEMPTDGTDSWADVAIVWAEIRAVSGKEYFGQQRDNFVTHKIYVRQRKGLSPKMRVIHAGRIYRIVNVLPWDDGTGITLMCEEQI